MHVSTDYVFGGDGDRTSPYTEEDPPCPLNVYGASKLAGENLLREECRRHLIVRTSGLYGLAGDRNFVAVMLGLAGKGRPIRVVDDQRLAPTYTAHLARKMVLPREKGTVYFSASPLSKSLPAEKGTVYFSGTGGTFKPASPVLLNRQKNGESPESIGWFP